MFCSLRFFDNQSSYIKRKKLKIKFKTYLITHKQVSPHTAKNYSYSVRKFLRWAAIGDPGKTKAMQYYRYLQEKGYANSTIANIVYALNHYFQFLGEKIRLTPPKRHKR
jgi:site-specific recombinase XerD